MTTGSHGEAPSPLVLGVRSLARLAALPRSRVRRAMGDGRLVTVATQALRGRTCHYVLVNGEGATPLDRWLSLQTERLWPVPLDELEIPRTNGGRAWFYRTDIERAFRAGVIQIDRLHGVVVNGDWIRWAASWMPDGERAAIVRSADVKSSMEVAA